MPYGVYVRDLAVHTEPDAFTYHGMILVCLRVGRDAPSPAIAAATVAKASSVIIAALHCPRDIALEDGGGVAPLGCGVQIGAALIE